MVIIGHSYSYFNIHLHILHYFKIESLGVDIFFIVSGFLVTASYLHRNNPGNYLWARFCRIWPALMVNAAILAFIVGPIITTSPLNSAYFKAAITYIYSNLFLLYPGARGLPGVFTHLSYPVLNSVLWTLNYEVIMYCILGVFGTLGLLFVRKRITIIVLCYLAFYITITPHLKITTTEFYIAMLRFSSAFITGMCFQLYKDKIRLTPLFFVIAILSVIFITRLPFNYQWFLALHILLTYIVIWIAYIPKKGLLLYNKLGDYSYGLYIYGWPVGRILQQYIFDPLLLTLTTAAVTTICATLSWHLIEKQALKLKSLATGKAITNNRYKIIFIGIFIAIISMLTLTIFCAPSWHSLSHHAVIAINA